MAYKIDDVDSTIVVNDNGFRMQCKTAQKALLEVSRLNNPPFDLEKCKKEKISVLQEKFQAHHDDYLASYPKAEVSSFDDKKSESLAYNLDINAPTPIIDNIVIGWGGTKADYIASILIKVHYLAQQEGAMVKIRDTVKACTTQAELDAIVV